MFVCEVETALSQACQARDSADIHQYQITQSNCWNMDEHGIAMGKCINSFVLSTSNKKRTYVESPESREWVSILECINGNGNSITPLIIFKGQNLQTSWFTQSTPDWQYTTSGNG
jgi:hypothetical protein